MIRTLIAAALAGVLAVAAGCTSNAERQPPGPSTTGPSATGPSGSAVLETGPPTSEPPEEPVEEPVEFDLTYPFAVPTATASIDNPSTERAYLVGIYVGDHRGDGDPPFQRISFYFRGDYPSYRFGYVPAIIEDARGGPVALEGTYFLNVVFAGAQAHDDTGSSTVAQQPPRPIGMTHLRDYADAGDFEGQVTYGIGVAAGPDGQPMVEVGQLKRSDGAGDYFYVVFVDVDAST